MLKVRHFEYYNALSTGKYILFNAIESRATQLLRLLDEEEKVLTASETAVLNRIRVRENSLSAQTNVLIRCVVDSIQFRLRFYRLQIFELRARVSGLPIEQIDTSASDESTITVQRLSAALGAIELALKNIQFEMAALQDIS